MLSAIDNGDDISNFDVPERIKRESKVTERLLNFYVTLLGGFTTARGDSFYLRLLKPEILDFFTKNSLNSLLGRRCSSSISVVFCTNTPKISITTAILMRISGLGKISFLCHLKEIVPK